MMGFKLGKTISAKVDEKVWLEIQSYKSTQHAKEFIYKMKTVKTQKQFTKNLWNLILLVWLYTRMV
jgi:hypothetical protein